MNVSTELNVDESIYFYILGSQPLELHLAQLATSRLSSAFAESTNKAYTSMFGTFLAFVVFMSCVFIR